MKRTHLPLNGLRVLDAAARHLSFTRAADELAVTPAAVGQQIRALEDMLGVVLFRRTPKGLELTDEAGAGLDSLREGFLRFEESVQAMQAGQASHKFTFAAPRDFFGAWFARRLADFQVANPDAEFHMAGGAMADFTEANLDFAVRLAEGPGDLEGVLLRPGKEIVVSAPNGPEVWISWPGVPAPDGMKHTVQVGATGQALAAVTGKMGRTRLPLQLVEDSLASGELVAIGDVQDSRIGYWLVAPRPQWRQKKVRALVEFLQATASE
ncbi:LysR family transcriptional regulator [Croceicoccus naphthovorans]|uniref:LysR family transcriptional regulator n=1 Tax=Croceicoccus naphthovorans TaxID=1348774 RepID=A0A0G3XG31_9SPHN|nr:LysR family transcriptional regulator [Croceicoccus naphthovorans]AKM09576.1 LysR family transcriptional regulator [Croceicoccus naphthovorans]MBB3989655.1 LysR family glycine cleavage system transcriptional activator [Croceicoccus naphthovorans]